jgi:hypothetical protein
MKKTAIFALAALAGGAFTTQADSIVTDWNDVTLQSIRASRIGPPMVARALAIVQTCMYDAWACYDEVANGTEFNSILRRPAAERTQMNKEIAISFAAYRALLDLFPAQATTFRDAITNAGLDPNYTGFDITTPEGLGNICASACITRRHFDGANQLGDMRLGSYSDYTGYVPVNSLDQIIDPNRWQPLRFSNGNGGTVAPGFIGAHWGNVTPFALTKASQFRPPPPARFPKDKSRYIKQTEHIIKLTANLDDRQKMIAEYWADGPNSELPPGHWHLFAQVVSARNNYTLDQDAKLFFALGNAMLDAGIATWEAKRFYDSQRPITSVRFLKNNQTIPWWPLQGGAPRTVLGQNWTPYQPDTFLTPPFAEHVSGHSTFSAAGAAILKSFTGSDSFNHSVTLANGSSRVEPGVTPAQNITLSWPTFSAAANEAGYSRLVGGIHYNDGDQAGRALGRKVGAAVWKKCVAMWTGKSQRGGR